MTHEKTIGTRAEVWHGTAKHTSGGLEKKDLFQNKHGRIVSKRKHFSEKKANRLVKAGYGTKKGKFGFVMLHGKSRKHGHKRGYKGRSRRMRGGNGINFSLNPHAISGIQGTTASNPSTNVQFAAGMGS